VTWGWENGFNKAAFEQAMADHRDDMSPSLLISGYLGDAPREPGRCLARTDLVSDSDWYGSPYFEILHKPMGYDHSMFCMREFSSRSGVHCCFTISRALRDADFSRRDRVLVQELNAALAPLVGGSLATLTDPSPADLAPRVRQVLRCLLEGDSDKQIAQRLGLARHTVNQYVKTIFHHFGVRSRTELLARWIRRAWSNGFNWADQ
jgi:DNA-binding CsgD family transcriptional regulator